MGYLLTASRKRAAQVSPSMSQVNVTNPKRSENMSAYQIYLKSPHWLGVRAKMLALAQHRCQHCCSGGELHVHHITYKSKGRERPEHLIVLCARCHKTLEDCIKEIGFTQRASLKSLRNFTHNRLKKLGVPYVAFDPFHAPRLRPEKYRDVESRRCMWVLD